MPNYHAQWANSALRPKLFGVIDAYAGLPLILLAFDLDNPLLFKIALLSIVVLSIMHYFGYTPLACYLALRRNFSRFVSGGRRGTSQFFEQSINRLLR